MGNITNASNFVDLSTVPISQDRRESIVNHINREKVLVYSKDYCPFCIATKKLLKRLGISANVYDFNLEESEKATEIQAILYELTGQKSVPNIFIKGKHIGGNREIQHLAKTGALMRMLEE